MWPDCVHCDSNVLVYQARRLVDINTWSTARAVRRRHGRETLPFRVRSQPFTVRSPTFPVLLPPFTALSLAFTAFRWLSPPSLVPVRSPPFTAYGRGTAIPPTPALSLSLVVGGSAAAGCRITSLQSTRQNVDCLPAAWPHSPQFCGLNTVHLDQVTVTMVAMVGSIAVAGENAEAFRHCGVESCWHPPAFPIETCFSRL